MSNTVIAWFSCGITSAVACKLALMKYENVELYYTDPGSQDEDSMRFLNDCQKWFGKEIHIVRSEEYENHFDVIEKKGMINTYHYFPCTLHLKKELRYRIEDGLQTWDGQVWGFDISEQQRAMRMQEQHPDTKPLFPLIEAGLSKENCAHILGTAGIELPKMYRLGYRNNNCIGCVRGGMGYWNKIRKDFPDVFDRMMMLEQKIGHSCIKADGRALFLNQLHPDRGDFPTEIMPECGLFCELEFVDTRRAANPIREAAQ